MTMKEIEAEAKTDLMREKEDSVKEVIKRLLTRIDVLNNKMKDLEKEYNTLISMGIDDAYERYGKLDPRKGEF